MSKVNNLSTQNPEIFGNSTQHQNKHTTNFDAGEFNKDRANVQTENQAISNWQSVGGKR